MIVRSEGQEAKKALASLNLHALLDGRASLGDRSRDPMAQSQEENIRGSFICSNKRKQRADVQDHYNL
ncbi:hypothetical protein J6590_020479 [Homalodisca vitripennis]|nr:hypothetical protein J6590_020479 [Homalodisca vitripennis]